VLPGTPETRFEALDTKATNRLSALATHRHEFALAFWPALLTLTHSVDPTARAGDAGQHNAARQTNTSSRAFPMAYSSQSWTSYELRQRTWDGAEMRPRRGAVITTDAGTLLHLERDSERSLPGGAASQRRRATPTPARIPPSGLKDKRQVGQIGACVRRGWDAVVTHL
jgi:hypothetical protein